MGARSRYLIPGVRAMSSSPLLQCLNVSCAFGGVRAVDNASLAIEPGTITGLIGPNGAGKSTLVSIISGYVRGYQGQVLFRGEDLIQLRPHQIAQKGLIRTFQMASEFPQMTVLENMMVAPQRQTGENFWAGIFRPRRWIEEERQHLAEARRLLRQFGLESKEDEYAGNLSGGQKRLLEMARALMAKPVLLLLDEPMAGVSGVMIDQLAEHIVTLNQQYGLTFLIIEHDLGFIDKLCSQVNVMVSGSVLAQGTMEQLREDERVVEAYLS